MNKAKPAIRKTARILVVDDDAAMGAMLRDFLTLKGYDVDCLTDGNSALNALRNNPTGYHGLVSDVRMVPLDGLKLLRQVKQEMPHLPVFLFTADMCEADKESALRLGAASYLAKPFPLSKLAEALQLWILR